MMIWYGNGHVCVTDVDVSRQKIYFASKTDATSEVRSVTLSSSDDVFDSDVDHIINDEVINGL